MSPRRDSGHVSCGFRAKPTENRTPGGVSGAHAVMWPAAGQGLAAMVVRQAAMLC
jgi:hypothetical protein